VSPQGHTVDRLPSARDKTTGKKWKSGAHWAPTFGLGLLMVTAVAIGLLAAWHLRQLLLLLFAAVLVSLALRGFASGIVLAVPAVGRRAAFVLASLISAAMRGCSPDCPIVLWV
jgi:hypothetical protein